MKLFLPSHTIALNTARGIDRLYPERNVAFLSLHIQNDLGYCEDIRNKLTVYNTTKNSLIELISASRKGTQCTPSGLARLNLQRAERSHA